MVCTVFASHDLDTLTETVVSRLLVGRVPAARIARDLAAGLAQSRPDLPALGLALPFTLAAAAIDEMLGAGAEAHAAALDAWRTAALIGAEALMLGLSGSASVAALSRHWSHEDPVFRADGAGEGAGP